MYRYKITIEYLGTGYVGWQHQPGLPSIQRAIEDAIFKFCQEQTEVYGSGRTDAGVHALGQVAHFDLKTPQDNHRIQRALNYYLTNDTIRILKVEEAPEDFHARFSALRRRYVYRLISRSASLALERNRAWYAHVPLDLKAMQEGARHLIGRHDFSTFRASACQSKSPLKTLDKLEITQEGELFNFAIEAPSFLHHQVRNFVGTLKLVGEGKWQPDDVKIALEKKDRTAGGPTADACGLYFHSVDYN